MKYSKSRFSEVIEPLFPQIAGEFVLPAYPVTDQLEWIIQRTRRRRNHYAGRNPGTLFNRF